MLKPYYVSKPIWRLCAAGKTRDGLKPLFAKECRTRSSCAVCLQGETFTVQTRWTHKPLQLVQCLEWESCLLKWKSFVKHPFKFESLSRWFFCSCAVISTLRSFYKRNELTNLCNLFYVSSEKVFSQSGIVLSNILSTLSLSRSFFCNGIYCMSFIVCSIWR